MAMLAACFVRSRLLGLRVFQRRWFSTDYSRDVADLNKEMEIIFGQSPSDEPFNSTSSQKPLLTPEGVDNAEPTLTHVDNSGEAKMVNVGSKNDTRRVAIATCRVLLGSKVFDLVASNQIGKGDVLNVAKIAGICGAKQTSNLIPLCHNINLSHVGVDLTLDKKQHSVEIKAEASTTGKTGVEMEAMTAAAIAGLTVYDMCKGASKEICITDICLQQKSGGKSGDWSREHTAQSQGSSGSEKPNGPLSRGEALKLLGFEEDCSSEEPKRSLSRGEALRRLGFEEGGVSENPRKPLSRGVSSQGSGSEKLNRSLSRGEALKLLGFEEDLCSEEPKRSLSRGEALRRLGFEEGGVL